MKKFITYNKKTGRVVSISEEKNEVDVDRFIVKEIDIDVKELDKNPVIHYGYDGKLKFEKNPLVERSERKKVFSNAIDSLKSNQMDVADKDSLLLELLKEVAE